MDLIINYRIGRNCNTGASLMVTSYCGLHTSPHICTLHKLILEKLEDSVPSTLQA